jgi:hypothetical protein
MGSCAVHGEEGGKRLFEETPTSSGIEGYYNRKGTGKQLQHRFAVNKFGQERKKQFPYLAGYLWGYVYRLT